LRKRSTNAFQFSERKPFWSVATGPAKVGEVPRLRRRGWYLNELGIHLCMAFRTWDTPEELFAAAADDLRPGTVVRWHGPDLEPAAGFVVGFDGLGPGDEPFMPGVLVLPDDVEVPVSDWDGAAEEVLARLPVLVAEAERRGESPELAREEARRAGTMLRDRLPGSPLPTVYYPFDTVVGHPRVDSLHDAVWSGFQEGWLEPDDPPLAERCHPRYMGRTPILDAAFREGAAAGIEACEQLSPWDD
jgi:hypothetical protein